MSSLQALRSDIEAEMDALSETVDRLETTVSEVEATVSENKLHGDGDESVVEQTTTATQSMLANAD